MDTETEDKPRHAPVHRVRLDRCSPGDRLSVDHVLKGHSREIGDVVISKIKPIPGGRVQLKYLAGPSGSKVLKLDLPGDLAVVRRSRSGSAVRPSPKPATYPGDQRRLAEGLRTRALQERMLAAAARAGAGEGRALSSIIGLGEMFDEATGRKR